MSNTCNNDDGILMKEQEIATRCTKKSFHSNTEYI